MGNGWGDCGEGCRSTVRELDLEPDLRAKAVAGETAAAAAEESPAPTVAEPAASRGHGSEAVIRSALSRAAWRSLLAAVPCFLVRFRESEGGFEAAVKVCEAGVCVEERGSPPTGTPSLASI